MKGKKEEIPFSNPFVPPTKDLIPNIKRIRHSGQLTNGGEFHREFEEALCQYFGVKYISLFSSGTLALIIALRALNLKGEVITTPFTSPATIQAIYWNNLTPVFVDIRKDDLNINPTKIESAITAKTCAILPVHIFGSPCDLNEIDRISINYIIPVIYDAAHSFGVKINGISICNFGDLSVLSFHATKVFNTLEGGAVICHDIKMKKHLDTLKNTGIKENGILGGYGLNAKMNELQAAYGLCHLKYMDEIMEKRKKASQFYFRLLKDIPGLHFQEQKFNVEYNYPYMPVVTDPVEYGTDRDGLAAYLEKLNIVTKKYFHPLVSDFKEFKAYKTSEMPVAEWISNNILCLPMFHDISIRQIHIIVDAIRKLHSSLKSQKKSARQAVKSISAS